MIKQSKTIYLVETKVQGKWIPVKIYFNFDDSYVLVDLDSYVSMEVFGTPKKLMDLIDDCSVLDRVRSVAWGAAEQIMESTQNDRRRKPNG